MSADERIQIELEDEGIDIEDDLGAQIFQDRLEMLLASERQRREPPRHMERVHGIAI